MELRAYVPVINPRESFMRGHHSASVHPLWKPGALSYRFRNSSPVAGSYSRTPARAPQGCPARAHHCGPASRRKRSWPWGIGRVLPHPPATRDQRQLVLPVGDNYFCRSHVVIIRYRSNRLESQNRLTNTGVVFRQGEPCLSMELRISSSLRMQAVRSSFFSLPAANSRW